MTINMVIVDKDVDRGQRAGRRMSEAVRRDFRGWEMHVHVRLPDNLLTDDAYGKYSG